MTDDQNPTRPFPHATPDRRYVDRRPSSERIPPAELAGLVDEFLGVFAPVKPKRVKLDETDGDDFDRGDQ